jgi:beta-mannosidase
MGRRRQLHSGWTVRPVDGSADRAVPADIAGRAVPATVPGVVHTDLLAAGLIPDPYRDRNEDDIQWIGRAGWRYETMFDWQPGSEDLVDLVCEGLDTVATIQLNDAPVADTANMHRSYRFAVADLLRSGANRLAVTFASALDYAEAQRDDMDYLPASPNPAHPHPYNFIRKMACNFGWDWGPVLVTAGIWRPVGLHSWSTARLARVLPAVTVEDGVGRVRVEVSLERAGGGVPVNLAARVAGVESHVVINAGEDRAVLELQVPNPRLWWPHGHGEQHLDDLHVRLERTVAAAAADTAPLDTWSRRIGFRTVRLDTSDDEVGSAFTLVVNDLPIFARGANWIPDDCFPTRVRSDRYRTRVAQARAANIDLLRVWGGGIYESDDFYDACDEAGVLVWQDFPFACAPYPEESPLCEEVEAEARENVARLMPHPSLVLWNGNNENYMGWHEWGWPEVVGDRTWGHGYYTDLLPRVVAETDPTRPYWPGSPYSGRIDLPVSLDGRGCKHIWDVWNTADYSRYRDHVPRFVSEFGWQAPPTWATLTGSVHDDPLQPDSAGMLHHQKASDGNGKLARGLAPHFPEPTTMEDWHFLNQLNQARAITVGVEHFRSHRGLCMGTVVWQLNDCWPVTSWAVIDGDGRLKPLWFALRRVYDPQLITVQPRSHRLHVFMVNDRAAAWTSEVDVRRHHVDGTVLAQWTTRLTAEAGSRTDIELPAEVTTPSDPRRELLLVTAGDRTTTWFFAEDKDVDYPSPAYHVEVTPDGDLHTVRVTASTLLRDLTLFADRIHPDAEIDSMLVTLLPGQTHDFHIRGARGLTAEQVQGPPVLRCVNDAALAAHITPV